MKDFRTVLKVQPGRVTINLKSRILTQGSCFSNAIGDRLASYKLNSSVNPFGVIYNPESIHKALTLSIYNEPVPDHTFASNQDLYVNFNFHSTFAALKRETLSSRLTNAIGSTHYFLKDCDWLMITYGTAWVYHRKDTGEIVANCHKLPSAMFTKSLCSTETIVASFRTFFEQLKRFNPAIRVILTLSPVRHLKDTIELNSVSKSVLRVACHQIAEQFDDVEYFPAYEMMLDDLRDYRFYKSDMIHPSEEAEDYIWERFMERYFSSELREFVQQWRIILSAIRHKPFHPKSSAHQQFLRDTLRKLEEFRATVKVDEEIAILKQQLDN